jgi:hypothetical protein
MPVFDTADKPVNPDHFAEKLVGAMCKVTFTLKHYVIAAQTKADGRLVEANDVFSAQVETIAILKNPPILTRSPYKGRLARSLRPHHRPQLPTRGEQVNAAAAFIPQPDFGPQLANQPPILSAVGHPPTTPISMSPSLIDVGITPTLSTATAPIANIAGTNILAPAAPVDKSLSTLPVTANTTTSRTMASAIQSQGITIAVKLTKY